MMMPHDNGPMSYNRREMASAPADDVNFNALAHYFGHSAMRGHGPHAGQKLANVTHRQGSEVFGGSANNPYKHIEGNNERISKQLMDQVRKNTSYLFRAFPPTEMKGNGLTVEWSSTSYESFGLDDDPDTAIPTSSSMQVDWHKSTLVRKGKIHFLEFGFERTPAGQEMFMNLMRKVNEGTLQTVGQGMMMALMSVRTSLNKRERLEARAPNTLDRYLRDELDMFAIMNGNPLGFQIVFEALRDRMIDTIATEPDIFIVPRGSLKFRKFDQSFTHPKNSGRPLNPSPALVAENGAEIYEAPTFRLGSEQERNSNVTERVVDVGGVYGHEFDGPHVDLNGSPDGYYSSNCRDTEIFSESVNGPVRQSFIEAIKTLFGPNGIHDDVDTVGDWLGEEDNVLTTLRAYLQNKNVSNAYIDGVRDAMGYSMAKKQYATTLFSESLDAEDISDIMTNVFNRGPQPMVDEYTSAVDAAVNRGAFLFTAWDGNGNLFQHIQGQLYTLLGSFADDSASRDFLAEDSNRTANIIGLSIAQYCLDKDEMGNTQMRVFGPRVVDLVQHDVAVPLRLWGVRPNKGYKAATAIAMSTPGLGKTYFKDACTTVGTNAARKCILIHFSVYFKSVTMNPDGVEHAENVFVSAYEGGCDHSIWDKNSLDSLEVSGSRRNRSVYLVAMFAGTGRRDFLAIDITGQYEEKLQQMDKSGDQSPHAPTLEYYGQKYGWEHRNKGGFALYGEHEEACNTLVFPEAQRVHKSGDRGLRLSHYIKNKGHFGDIMNGNTRIGRAMASTNALTTQNDF